jgi:hypothetical protein
MKEVTRYIRAEVNRKLMERSSGMCECCGTDIKVDRHHIHRFSEGGKSNIDNLICLCQTCHKQIPLLLSQEQQHSLQLWHQNNTANNYHFNHHLYSPTNTILLGGNYFLGCSTILSINNQKIIRTYEIDGKFYLNAVMLDNFDPQLLVLANRIIYSSEAISSTNNNDRITLQNQNKLILSLERTDKLIKAEMNFTYNNKGSLVLFDFNRNKSQLFKGDISGCTFHSSGGTAYSFNS